MIFDGAIARIYSISGTIYLEGIKGQCTELFSGTEEECREYFVQLESRIRSKDNLINLEEIGAQVKRIFASLAEEELERNQSHSGSLFAQS
ncbi:hypothetical protein [Roseofilum casamattae]|uniref:Uncharacterized protein n=1 Tax=Roseofilum casamattae BLCC-M143 TaxID=3022442 RepID=A0ABT7C390_9CYAN|nr:hypothetical protein [Roseofilum casamattae]MDJ1185896.1 hypothetical protein [Roseofilum casamattae BLCC-M143]